ncbi:hypothetical protein [Candidatus Uabimicrobium sp. HlEnr_7]|uniref:hypothetical protein n=1 Tax=Candidatus Uabimicrobium helgolandensis TaxID=3095367 RepID=UPI00355910C6
MRKFTLLLFSISIMIFVPIIIVFFGFILTQKNKIVIEERILAPQDWSIAKIAHRHAPILLQEVNTQNPNWDFICRVNFDNDWDPLNNSNNILAKNAQLDPAIYYSVIESKTHFYITYSIFHALDWGLSNGTIRKWYENDVKNLQVVIEKHNQDSIEGKVIFVTLQDGEDIKIYNASPLNFRRKNKDFEKEKVILLNEFGAQEKNASHPTIFIEKGRHNLQVAVAGDIRLVKKGGLYKIGKGITYLPSTTAKGETPNNNNKLNYALLDLSKLLWERKAENPDELYSFFNNERLDYHDDVIQTTSIPIYFHGKQLDGYEANTINPNVLPFFIGKAQKGFNPGVLFFNPIKAYNQLYDLPNCSLIYTYHPFAKSN